MNQPSLVQYGFLSLLIWGLNATTLWSQKNINSSFDLELGTDLSLFFSKGAYEQQKQVYPAFYLQPEYALDWKGGMHNINFKGFLRYDPNGNSRDHVDVRELYYQYVKNNWELSVGAKRIFWGKTESAHLVDVINQVDFLEGIDGEEKLGQPMVQLSYASTFGTFDLFYLPYSRSLQFGNAAGRPRTPIILSDEEVRFEASQEAWAPSASLRWSHFIGPMDIGLHYFYGNAREPLLDIQADGAFGLLHPEVHQVGLDYQVIVKDWILKLETMYRAGGFDNIFATATGFEYTFSNIKNSGIDVGLLGEYLYDSRRELAFTSLDNDVFAGARIVFNNAQSTEFLLGFFSDLSKSSKLLRLEGNQRIGENYKMEVTSQFFLHIDEREFLYAFREDSFLQLTLIRYF
ncbi:MAG: hypothetical protein AAGG75_09585 [Bacteroidota bacterium]